MAKTVLITGASGGIGSAVAYAFAGAGYSLALGYNKNAEGAQALFDSLKKNGANAQIFKADVTSTQQVNEMFTEAEKAFGTVDVLVNNAGIAQQKMFCDITDDDWKNMLDVNTTGTFLCCRRAAPAMVRQKSGCIINISSMWGQIGASCEVHYSAAKAAVIGLTKALAKELAPSGVRVNCVAPGAVQTAMMSGFSPEDCAALCEEIPLGRLGTPQEAAEAVLFLAENAGYITGQVISPNGGMVI